MRTLKEGILIAVEGIDGSGKSTFAKNLVYALEAEEFPVFFTKEPGGTQLGMQLRTILQEKNVTMCPRAEFLLFASDRAQHFDEMVIPALEAKKIVVSDRMSDSSLVYQGYGRGLEKDKLNLINAWAMQDVKPDLTFYIEIPIDLAMQRILHRKEHLTSFEKEGKEFSQKLLDGFQDLYKNRSDVITLDGTNLPQTITTQAMDALRSWISAQQ
jgi:dTMP kinase